VIRFSNPEQLLVFLKASKCLVTRRKLSNDLNTNQVAYFFKKRIGLKEKVL